VEGRQVLFNWILHNIEGFTQSHRQKSFVMDCGGKFQIDKFMTLCKEFEISHLVIHDIDDEKKEYHKIQNSKIQQLRNPFTREIFTVDPDIEKRLGIKQADRDSDKPLVLLEFLSDNANRDNQFLGELSQSLARNMP
jgi:hypothetical protein